MKRYNWKENFDEILKGNIRKEYSNSIRKLLFENNIFPYKCNKCNIDKWNNEKITLEIEHKDGDRFNNSKENLELLCPNCHSQTPTFRKNRKNNSRIYLDQNLVIKEFYKSNNIGELIINLGLIKNESNYKKVRKILENNNLKFFFKKKDFKPRMKKDYSYIKNIIIEHKIDMSVKNWGIKLSEPTGLTPSRCLKIVKENFPELIIDIKKENKTFQDIINERINKYNNSGLDKNKNGFYIELGNLYGISKWAAKSFFEKYINKKMPL